MSVSARAASGRCFCRATVIMRIRLFIFECDAFLFIPFRTVFFFFFGVVFTGDLVVVGPFVQTLF